MIAQNLKQSNITELTSAINHRYRIIDTSHNWYNFIKSTVIAQ